MSARIVVLVLLFLSMAPIPTGIGVPVEDPGGSWRSYYLLIGGNITNLGDEPVYVNETDLLIYDLPLNTSTQESYIAWARVQGKPANYTIRGRTVYVELPPGVDPVIDPGETVSSEAEFIVKIDLDARRRTIENFSSSAAAPWSAMGSVNKSLTEATGLWNYTNPLVGLAVKYFRRKGSSSPYQAVMLVVDWVTKRTRYRSRIPARHPWEVIVYREGDCDDQSNLFISILRGMGIPSYIEIGAVYLPNYETSGSSGEYYHYRMKGGGYHGWAVAYIPPWGYVRVDLTIPSSPVPPVLHVKQAAYYTLPTIVTNRVYRRDYAEAGARFLSTIEERRLRYDIYVELGVYNG